MRKLMLLALAACCLLAAGAPIAGAKTHRAHASSSKVAQKVHAAGVKISKLGTAVLGLDRGIKNIQDIDLGQTAAINRNVDAQKSLKGTVDAIVAGVPAIIDGLNQLKDGLTQISTVLSGTVSPALTSLAAGLTDLSTAVQGPDIAGQLGAAGSDAPGDSNAATPAALPTGTVYRQIVLSTGGAFGPGAPIGARTWVKMPDVAAIGYSNKYACTSAGATDTAAGAGYTVTCSTP